MEITVVRHPRENRKKCSLRHLCGRSGVRFFNAVDGFGFDASGYTLLEMDAPPVSPDDACRPLLLLDSTWFLLPRIRGKIRGDFVARSIPPTVKTAYPRVSKTHTDPDGLATIEALYAALFLMGIPDKTLLDGYPFAERFLRLNNF